MKNKLTRVLGHPYFSFGIAAVLLIAIVLLVAFASFALLNFSVAAPTYPEASAIVEEQSFGEYVGLVELTFEFLSKVIGVLIAALILTIGLFASQMYIWAQDKRKLARWQETGLVVERLEFRSGNRLRVNNIEIELNRAQFTTLKELVNKRKTGETLHPADLPGDNGTQMIKRLREELGARLLEKSLIKSRRGKGYWIEIDPSQIKDEEDED